MRCALVNTATGQVENLIVASESDPVETGYLLKADPAEWVTIGTTWDGADFVRSGTAGVDYPEPIDGLESV